MKARSTKAALQSPREASVLRAQVRVIVVVTLIAVATAVLVSWVLQKPEYRSQVQILVGPRLPTGGSPVPPDMETEIEVATSGLVISEAASEVRAAPSDLRRRLSVTVPADTTVLWLTYADTSSDRATRGAAALADAYITYRVGQASLLSPATTPRTATGPNFAVNALAGLAIGVLLGVGAACLRDRRDDRLRGPREFGDLVALPVLETVSVDASRAATRQPVMVRSPDSTAAEAYRYLRAKVVKASCRPRHGTDAAQGPLVVSVTSAVEDEGASLVAANLAGALARAGRRVVLVAGDVRSPALPELVGEDSRPGLTEVLRGEAAVSRALRRLPVDGLLMLPSGAVPSDPGELIDAPSLSRLVKQMPGGVDDVVVLSPPVLAAAESLAWADVAELVILVAAIQQSTRRDLVAAAHELQAARGHLLGGVLHEGPVPTPDRARSEHATGPTSPVSRTLRQLPSGPDREGGRGASATPDYAERGGR